MVGGLLALEYGRGVVHAERATVLHDLAVAQADHPLGLLRDVGLVGDQDHSPSFFVQAREYSQHVLGGVRVQVAGRLIGEDQRGVGHDRPCDRDPLLLPARQLRRLMMQAVTHTDRVQCPFGAPPALCPPQSGVGERQLHVDQCARARHQVEALEDEADLAVAQVG